MTEEEAMARYFEKEMPGPETRVLFDTARELGIGFYLGYAEISSDGRRYNTSILVDANARIVGRYRKIHLPGHSDHKPDAPFQHLEKKFFEVGNDGFNVWETLGTRIGMCLCNDRRWTETWRVLALQGAEIVALGYNTPSLNIHWNEPVDLRMFHHLLSLQAGAYQNACWVAAAAKASTSAASGSTLHRRAPRESAGQPSQAHWICNAKIWANSPISSARPSSGNACTRRTAMSRHVGAKASIGSGLK